MLGDVELIELKMQSKWQTSGNASLYGIVCTCVISSKLQYRVSDSVIASVCVRARTVAHALQCHEHIQSASP